MKKSNFVITARGRQLDIISLKAANANIKPVGTRSVKSNINIKTAIEPVKPRTTHINATIPAPRPAVATATEVIKHHLFSEHQEKNEINNELSEKSNFDIKNNRNKKS